MADNFFADLEGDCDKAMFTDPRKAAELLFAQAVIKHRRGERQSAKTCAETCLNLLKGLNIQTESEATACFSPSINGVSIPELFHEGTVQQRFADIGLKI